MKKLLMALLVSVILTVCLASPAVAAPPENNPGLDPYQPGWYGLVLGAMLGIYQNWVPGRDMGMYSIDVLAILGPPVKWQYGQWK